jgi:hypothetical protein
VLVSHEAHQNGWHAASSYRNAILNSELAFPIFMCAPGLPAIDLHMCLQKNICLQKKAKKRRVCVHFF